MINIFLVEDNKTICSLLERFFQSIVDMEIIQIASNGQIAVDLYLLIRDKIDLIIMDNRMPLKNGIEASIEMLKINKDEKIIFASADSGIREKTLALGAVAFISKPFNLEDLEKIVRYAFENKL